MLLRCELAKSHFGSRLDTRYWLLLSTQQHGLVMRLNSRLDNSYDAVLRTLLPRVGCRTSCVRSVRSVRDVSVRHAAAWWKSPLATVSLQVRRQARRRLTSGDGSATHDSTYRRAASRLSTAAAVDGTGRRPASPRHAPTPSRADCRSSDE